MSAKHYLLTNNIDFRSQALRQWTVLLATMLLLATSGTMLPVHGYNNPKLFGRYFDYAVFIIMENHALSTITQSAAPYMYSLAQNYSQSTNYFQIQGTIDSEPNYLALTSGATQDPPSSDDNYHLFNADNVVNKLDHSGYALTWKAYMDSMGTSGCVTSNVGSYAIRHNPFPFYQNIVNNSTRCDRIVAATAGQQLVNDLNGGTQSNFMWLTPNVCEDMHGDSSCGSNCGGASCIAVGNGFLNNLVPSILTSALFTSQQRAALFITFDECSCSPNAPVYFVVAGPTVKTHFSSSTTYNHYNWLDTILYNWNIPCLVNDCGLSPMSEFFAPPVPSQTNWDPMFATSVTQICNDSGQSSTYLYWHPNVHNTGAGCVTINNTASMIETNSGSGTLNNPDSPTVQQGNFPWQAAGESGVSACQNQKYIPYFQCPRNTYGLMAKAYGQYPLELNTTLTMTSLTDGGLNSYYHIFVGLYFWFPDGNQTKGGSSYGWLEAQVRFGSHTNGAADPIGQETTWNPGNAFGYSKLVRQASLNNQLATANFDVSAFFAGALAFWGLPAGTRGLLSGIEVGTEGYGGVALNTSFTTVSLHTHELPIVNADVNRGQPSPFDRTINILDISEVNFYWQKCQGSYGSFPWTDNVNPTGQSAGCIDIQDVSYDAFYFGSSYL